MTSKEFLTFGFSAMAAAWMASAALAEDAAESAATPKANVELDGEVRYVEALLDAALPDFAEIVMQATVKRWPEAEARFFALEVRRLLLLGKDKEALELIGTLPDRKGAKYWAARLEVAMSYYANARKTDAKAIYDEFFKTYPKPPPELREFHMNASYTWGRMLLEDQKFVEAARVYEVLLGLGLERDKEGLMTCETAEIYLRLAEGAEAKARAGYIDRADRLIKKLLWMGDMPVYFCRGIAMRAHCWLLRGQVGKAQEIINTYMPQLRQLHDDIVKVDPDGSLGFLRLSPMPQSRYLMAEMLWKAAQAEFKKPKRDDDRIKDLLFGEKTKGGKRNGAGAFNHAINVFVKYPESAWAAKAGEMQDAIQKFVEQTYGVKVGTTITLEQMSRVRAMQFRNAQSKFAEQKYEEAIKEYLTVLAQYPELIDSVRAVENLATCYLELMNGCKDPARLDELRMNADAVEGYLAERFAGTGEKALMAAAGDATTRLAAKEKELGQVARSEHLYREFFVNYRDHANAPVAAYNRASELQNSGRYADAIEVYKILGAWYTNSVYYAVSFIQSSTCYDKLGDRENAISSLSRYLEVETSALRRTQARMMLANMYKNDGVKMLTSAETNATPEAVAQTERMGSAQIIRAIKQFNGFAAEADRQIADPGVQPGDKAKYSTLKEQAMFLVGDCWGRLTRPETRLKTFREKAAASYEAYLKAYPTGVYSTNAYVRIGTIYTALGDMQKTKDALERLSKAFPDSPEAKNAKPRLAKSLMEMGLKKEATDVYAEMLSTAGSYNARQFLAAGRALTEANSWQYAAKAYEKAVSLSGTNDLYTVAEARVGQAQAAFKRGALGEARDVLDQYFDDKKLSAVPVVTNAYLLLIQVASKQGMGEQNATKREQYFGTAIGGVKKLRNYIVSPYATRITKDQKLLQDVKFMEEYTVKSDEIDLLSSKAQMDMVEAQERFGDSEGREKMVKQVAGKLESLVQMRRVSEQNPIDRLSARQLAILERLYVLLLQAYAKMGETVAETTLRYGQEYLDIFPNGTEVQTVRNCMNVARAMVGKKPKVTQAQPVSETPAAAEQAAPAPVAPAAGTNEIQKAENGENK